jgi:hypothetical protein
VADYTDEPNEHPQPEILWLAFTCRNYNALPCEGAILDQPEWLLRGMNMAERVHRATSLYNQRTPGQEGKFSKMYPDEFKIVNLIDEIRANNGKSD